MTVKELIVRLKRMPKDAVIDVMVETEEPVQYQFPVNGIAYSARTDTVIIMHEQGIS